MLRIHIFWIKIIHKLFFIQIFKAMNLFYQMEVFLNHNSHSKPNIKLINIEQEFYKNIKIFICWMNNHMKLIMHAPINIFNIGNQIFVLFNFLDLIQMEMRYTIAVAMLWGQLL